MQNGENTSRTLLYLVRVFGSTLSQELKKGDMVVGVQKILLQGSSRVTIRGLEIKRCPVSLALTERKGAAEPMSYDS